VPNLLARARFWPGIAAVILITITVLPPAAGYARQYAFAQALQFVIFAVAGPALLVPSAPQRIRPPGRGGRPGRDRGLGRIRQRAGRLASPAARLALTAHPVITALRPPASGRKLPRDRPHPQGSRCHRREPGPATYGGR
jgi:hypothetical protein